MAFYTSNANWLLLCGFRSFVFLDGALAMTKTDGAVSAGELLGNLPPQYVDGPDYCTVTDATGEAFARTVQPELMKLMEKAARRSPVPATENMQDAPCCRYQRVADLQRRHSGMATQKYSTN
jgi:hypothetical protein